MTVKPSAAKIAEVQVAFAKDRQGKFSTIPEFYRCNKNIFNYMIISITK